jgi:hypothetical protein
MFGIIIHGEKVVYASMCCLTGVTALISVNQELERNITKILITK